MDYYKLKVLNNKKKIIIIIILIVITLSALAYFLIDHSNSESDDIVLEKTYVEDNNIETNNDIYVDVKGCINKPGVYSFSYSENARVDDLIKKAGGLTENADTSTINLSKKLDDEMTVIIYSKGEIKEFSKTQEELKSKLEICERKLANNACIRISENQKTNEKVNINEADLDELLKLSGIGEAKAKAIIEYRKSKRFDSIEDIKNVEGIGESLFTSIKDNITV